MRPLPGAPGVAAAAALLLLLLPRARADEHEHTVRGVPGWRDLPRPAPLVTAPAGLVRPGKHGGRVEPRGRPRAPSGWAWRSRNPGSWEEAFPCAPGTGLRAPSAWASFLHPDLNGAPPRDLGAPGAGGGAW